MRPSCCSAGQCVLIGLTFAGGELSYRLGLPRVLGYLVTGMIIGPFALDLIPEDLIDTALFESALLLAIGLVGYSIGSSIRLDEVREAGRTVTVIGLFEAYSPFFLVTIGMIIIGFDLMAALVIGSIALATAPVLVLSITQQYRTHGPVTRTVLPLVAIDDVLAVATFGFIIAFASSFYEGGEASVIEPIVEIAVSVSLGVITGVLTWLLARREWSDMGIRALTATMAIVSMLVGLLLEAELMILGIAFGVTFGNLVGTDERDRLDRVNKPLVGVSVMLVMALIGTTLDVTAIFSLVVLLEAALYIALRSVGKIGGARLGATLVNATPTVRRYLGWTLLAAAGVSLTFVAAASAVLPAETAARMGAMIGAAAVVNEIIAVFATLRAFRAAGEIDADVASS